VKGARRLYTGKGPDPPGPVVPSVLYPLAGSTQAGILWQETSIPKGAGKARKSGVFPKRETGAKQGPSSTWPLTRVHLGRFGRKGIPLLSHTNTKAKDIQLDTKSIWGARLARSQRGGLWKKISLTLFLGGSAPQFGRRVNSFTFWRGLYPTGASFQPP